MAKKNKTKPLAADITVAEPGVSRRTLDETPARTLAFLRGVGTSLPVRATLNAHGYSARDHNEGWRLLKEACGYSEDEPVELIDIEVRDAIKEVDVLDEDLFRIVRATLERRHPPQAKFVLRGLGPSTGMASVLGVSALLDRFDALDSGEERKATRKQDRAALETLATRGIDDAQRKRLRALVKKAKSAPPVSTSGAQDAERAEALRADAMLELRGWYEEWAEIARASIKRRDHLIRLGLASRRASGKGDDEEPNEPVPTNEPVAPANG
jgi:hypothetical protein